MKKYTMAAVAIIGITPDNGVVDEPLVTSAPIYASNYVPYSLTWTKSKRADETEEFEADMSASFWNLSSEDYIGYFAIGVKNCTVVDNTTAISALASSKQETCNVSGGKGCITIKASETRTVSVYNANGQKVAELNLKGGEEKTVSLQPGIYIVDKKKVLVR